MRTTLLLSALLASAISGHAAAITINNAGFESPNVGSGNIVNGSATGWNVSNGNSGTWNLVPNTFFTGGAPEGSQILFVGFGAVGDVNQTLGASLTCQHNLYAHIFRRPAE